ncbi:hypothetical protein ACHAXT_006483, partial [Thalassiosira profunda]
VRSLGRDVERLSFVASYENRIERALGKVLKAIEVISKLSFASMSNMTPAYVAELANSVVKVSPPNGASVGLSDG